MARGAQSLALAREEILGRMKVALGSEPADLAVTNGQVLNVYTGELLKGDTVLIKGDRIAYVGQNPRSITPATRVVDARPSPSVAPITARLPSALNTGKSNVWPNSAMVEPICAPVWRSITAARVVPASPKLGPVVIRTRLPSALDTAGLDVFPGRVTVEPN